jgi:organic radical activating enzyme
MRGRLVEIFPSFQGEGKYMGTFQIFIRFAGCNLRCPICDTKYALKKDIKYFRVIDEKGNTQKLPNPVESEIIRDIITKFLFSYKFFSLTLTGGEPLLQVEFIKSLILQDIQLPIYLETNGTLYSPLRELCSLFKERKQRLYLAMDIKLPFLFKGKLSFWEAHEQFLEEALKEDIEIDLQIKVLIDESTPTEELTKAANIVKKIQNKYPTKEINFILQPIIIDKRIRISKSKSFELYKISSSILSPSRVYFLPQMHKFLSYR